MSRIQIRSFASGVACGGATLALAVLQATAGGLQPQGAEYPLTRGIPGDQVNPSIALSSAGGFLVWQDAAIDGAGLGVAGTRLSEDGVSPVGSVFRVNSQTAGDQENPALATLPDGGAFCVWQGGSQGFQKIVGRVLRADGSPLAGDLAVSEGDGENQLDPAVACLSGGDVVVVWASYRQEGSFAYDVYGRVLSPAGVPRGPEFRLNVSQGLNRRSPAVTALKNGGFLATWIQERQVGVRDRADTSGRPVAGAGAPVFEITVIARAFGPDGTPWGSERAISSVDLPAAHPAAATLPDGRVVVAWTRRDRSSATSRFDIAARFLDATGSPNTPEVRVNAEAYGDQYRPRLATSPYGALAVWTSMGQDSSWEGVFGRWIGSTGQPEGDDIPVNSQTGGGQILPALAVGRDSNLLVAWSSNRPRTGYELFAQRLAPLLLRARPAARSGALQLQWPTVPGAVYQLQYSKDGTRWVNAQAPRAATGATDSLDVDSAAQMVLYRVVRVQ